MLDRIVAGRTDLVFDYLASGKRAISGDENGVSLLQWCAYYGDVSAMKQLLAHGAQLDVLGQNLGLSGAAFHGYWRLCEFLLENGADVNKADPGTHETPLHAATSKAGRPAYDLVIRTLLAHGADPNSFTKPFQETGCFMRDCRTKGETPLHRAAAFGGLESIQLLLDAGANIEAKDADGESPLGWASWHLRPDAILRVLCYNSFHIHPGRRSSYDHGSGWGAMEISQLGTPQQQAGPSKSGDGQRS